MDKQALLTALILIDNGGRPGTIGADLIRLGLADYNLKTGWSIYPGGLQAMAVWAIEERRASAAEEMATIW